MNERIVGKITGQQKGYQIIVIVGMHGNEPAGLMASQKVLRYIEENNIPVAGNITVLKGNMKALEKNVRYIDKDLNRMWTDEFITKQNPEIYEEKELKELNACIEKICAGDYQNCVILDFHSFSTESGAFAIPADNSRSVLIAKQFGLPFIEKLTSDLSETAIQYFANKGASAVVFEGGQHEAEDTVYNIEAAAFVALNYLQVIDNQSISKIETYKQRLKKLANGSPTHYELAYIHRIKPKGNFFMNPGYINFDKIKKNELLAFEDNTQITAKKAGFILMPLYQKKGNNGFYVVREVK